MKDVLPTVLLCDGGPSQDSRNNRKFTGVIIAATNYASKSVFLKFSRYFPRNPRMLPGRSLAVSKGGVLPLAFTVGKL